MSTKEISMEILWDKTNIKCPWLPRSIHDTTQSHRETISLWNSPGDHFVWFKLSTRFVAGPILLSQYVAVGFLFAQLERCETVYRQPLEQTMDCFTVSIYITPIWILTYLGAQNGPQIWPSGAYLLHTYNSSSNDLINKVSSESRGNFSRKLLAEDSRKSTNSIWQEVVAVATQRKPEQEWSAWMAWRWV